MSGGLHCAGPGGVDNTHTQEVGILCLPGWFRVVGFFFFFLE